MKIKTVKVPIRDLVRNYVDNGEEGVFTYNSEDKPQAQLVCRPKYQREFVYTEAESASLMDSIMHDYPIGIFYWSEIDDPKFKYEILDGQQRTLSICKYITSNSFSVRDMFYNNLPQDMKDQILDYNITVNICSGKDSEKLAWFKIINKSGEPLTDQELRNATYAGVWLDDAKTYFSKANGPAVKMSDTWINVGNPIRQDFLEKVLKWICYRDHFNKIENYMAIHEFDKDANDLWQYFQDILSWERKIFPKAQSKLLTGQDWGKLYCKYKDQTYNSNDLQKEINKLMADDDVTHKTGIIPYVLSEKTILDERYLNIRTFTHTQMMKKYQEQEGICPICGKYYDFKDMQGDHIKPWSQGGKTEYNNLQMLCKKDNEAKSNKLLKG